MNLFSILLGFKNAFPVIISWEMERFVVLMNGWHDARSPDKMSTVVVSRRSLVRQASRALPHHHHIPRLSTTSACFGSSSPLRQSSSICLILQPLSLPFYIAPVVHRAPGRCSLVHNNRHLSSQQSASRTPSSRLSCMQKTSGLSLMPV
jgi:hypothetical protein